jgi:hypothetical protein
MNSNSGSRNPFFRGQDWATMISGVGQGVGSGLSAASMGASTKQEANELKRRTLADLLNRSMKRDSALFRTNQEYSDDMSDYQSQAMQQMAKGFVDALKGSTRRR